MLEELARRAELHARRALDAVQPAGRFDHVRFRTPASVTPAKQIEGAIDLLAILVVLHAPHHLLGGEVAVVGVGGREMGEDPAPVDPLPYKGVVLRLVGVVPRELLGEEVVASCLSHELRQRAGVAEDVGEPELLRLVAELPHEIPLTVKELPRQRFA
jgi:hypothetical protein